MAMHWSWPEGRDFLVWLTRAGGTGDAWAYFEATRRLHPNNGASSARRLLAELGIENPETAVRQMDGGVTEQGRRASIYSLRWDVLRGMRLIIACGWERWLGVERVAMAHKAELVAALTGDRRLVQAGLF